MALCAFRKRPTTTVLQSNYTNATAFELFEGTFLQNVRKMGHFLFFFLSAPPSPPLYGRVRVGLQLKNGMSKFQLNSWEILPIIRKKLQKLNMQVIVLKVSYVSEN